MAKTRNKLSHLLLLCAALPVGAAFSHSADAAEIRISWWGGNQRHEATLAAINAFQKANPTITVKAEYAGWDGYLSRLSTQMAGGQDLMSFVSTGTGCRSFPVMATASMI